MESTAKDIRSSYYAAQKRYGGQAYDAYILLDHTVPWVQDGTRNEKNSRQWFHEQLEFEIKASGVPYHIIDSPDYADRFNAAVSIIDKVMSE